jgi:hypothetical protein
MEEQSTEWVGVFERRLHDAKVPQLDQPAYHRWIRFYLSFCQRFGYPSTAPNALGPFLTKLADKNYAERGRFCISTHFIEVAALDAPTELLLKIIRHPESLPHPLVSAPHSC